MSKKIITLLCLGYQYVLSSELSNPHSNSTIPHTQEQQPHYLRQINLYGSCNNNSFASNYSNISDHSTVATVRHVFYYPENTNEEEDILEYHQAQQERKDSYDNCCCAWQSIGCTGFLAIIGYLIFH